MTIYRLDPEGRLALITWARTAAPKSANEWVLGEGSQWVRTDGPAGGRRIAGTQSDFADLTYTLNIDPLWLSHFGIWAKLLPQSTLSILAAPHSSFYIPNEYQTWVQVRIAQAFFPGALALLACGLSFVWLSYSVSVVSLFGVALTGYMAHVFMKIFVIFGERAFLAPVLSAWTIPLLVLAVAAAHFVSMRLRYGGGLLPRLRGPQARNETAVSGG